ncbi:MAG: group II truncated hemoglobin [Betaproteobacteria bacterium]|nr:group II truncated hemoglobin [Betaproteobacteria bacterium]
MLREISVGNHYQRIGGEVHIRQLVHRFYEIMDELPEAYGIRKMHGADLAEIEEKFVKFLSGWMGGPQLYIEQYGHPMLRFRHLPFSIGMDERDQWLMCMDMALMEVVQDSALRRELSDAFVKVANHMQNRAEDSSVYTEAVSA